MAVLILCAPLVAGLLISALARAHGRTALIVGLVCMCASLGGAVHQLVYFTAPLAVPDIVFLRSSYMDVVLGGGLDRQALTWIICVQALVFVTQVPYALPEIGQKISYRQAYLAGLIWVLVFAAGVMVSAQDVVQLVIGWQSIGVVSVFILGFNYRKSASRSGALIGFVIQRLADFALLIAVAALALHHDSTSISEIYAADYGGVSWAGWLLCFAVMVKAGQPIFHGWLVRLDHIPMLPLIGFAIAGPLAAGVFVLQAVQPMLHGSFALTVFTSLCAVSALLSAVMSYMQIQSTRAWSFAGLSLTGLVFVAVAHGAQGTTMGLLSAIAFALMGLAMASANRAMEGETDLRFLGGLGRKMPFSLLAMSMGTVYAITALGYLDDLPRDLELGVSLVAGVLGLTLARLAFLMFAGSERGHKHAHDTGHDNVHGRLEESPWVFWLPMVLLGGAPFGLVQGAVLEIHLPVLGAALGAFIGLGLAIWRGISAPNHFSAEFVAQGLGVIWLYEWLAGVMLSITGLLHAPFGLKISNKPIIPQSAAPKTAMNFAIWLLGVCVLTVLWVWWRIQ